MNQKYKYLQSQGINNVLYPIKNVNGKYLTRGNEDYYYVLPYIMNNNIRKENQAVNMADELTNMHLNTTFKRQLSKEQSKQKMGEIYEYLDYKFMALELFVRSIEARPYNEFSAIILKNYYVILDTKKDMATLQQKLIVDIKNKKSVNMSFIHNNPKLNHLLNDSGNNYFISLEKSKIGVGVLDMCKYYIENESLNVDIKSIIDNYFQNFPDEFYYNYFCFMVLFYYIKGIKIYDLDYVSSQNFLNTTKAIKKFKEQFIDSK